MRLPNTITIEAVATELGWSTSKAKAFVRKNQIPYHAQAKTYYLDANVLNDIRKILLKPLGEKRDSTRTESVKANYKAGIKTRNLTLQIKELEAKVGDGSATADEKKQLAQLKGETPSKAKGK